MVVFTLALIAKFQPYKNKGNNTVDIILLLTLIIPFISSSMHYAGEFMYQNWLSEITTVISVLIILSYQVFLILAYVFPKAIQCCKKCKMKVM